MSVHRLRQASMRRQAVTYASPAVVQQATPAQATATSVTVTLGSTPTPGNLLIAAYRTGIEPATAHTAPDGTWTIRADRDHSVGGVNAALSVWSHVVESGDGTGYTFAGGASTTRDLTIYELAGVDTTTPVTVTPVSSQSAASGLSAAVGPLATLTVPALVLAVVAYDGGTSAPVTWGSPFTAGTGSTRLRPAHHVYAAGDTPTATVTHSGTTRAHAAVLIAINAATT